MAGSVASVFEAARSLSERDRGKLIEELVQSLDGEQEEGVEEAWDAEIEARLARHDAGNGKVLTMDEAVQRMRRAAGVR
jgi:putative addiction module component (TIGR02574 family)